MDFSFTMCYHNVINGERDDIMDKQKLLFVCESFGGGTFSYLQELVSAVSDTYSIYIAHSMRPETPEDFETKFSDGVTFIRLENLVREISPRHELKAARELRRIVKEIEPDIIHLHSSKAGAIGRLAINSKKYKVFYTPHGYSFLMHGAGKVKKSVYYLMEAFCAKTGCTTISCSLAEDRVTKRLTGRSAVVNNGINTSVIDRCVETAGKAGFERLTFFSIGRICYHKRPEIFNSLAEKFPEHDFVWIGDGPERHLLTAENIRVTGWLERMSAVRIAAGADVFILPSFSEGLSLSLLEAMYLEKICIVSNVIGNRDVIRDGENGFLCDTLEDYEAAVEAVSDPSKEEMLSKMKKAAKADVLEKYNTDVMKREYIRIYSE